MINMKLIFHSNTIILKNEHLHVYLSRFYKNCIYLHMKCPMLQNGLQINEILNFFNFQVNGALTNTCVLSNYACYNHKT
jgi:hypothetical protein